MKWFNMLSLKGRIIFIVSLACFVCSAIAFGISLYVEKQELHSGIVDKSSAIHLRLDAVTNYIGAQGGLLPLIDQMKSKYKSHLEMTKEDKELVLKQVPIFAAMKIGAKDSEKDDYEFRVFSDVPRNEANQSTPNEAVIFKKFNADSSLEEQIENDGKFITVYRPIRLTKAQGCFTCHGDPKESPWGNGRDVLGFQMENYKEGKLHGVFAIKTEIAKVVAKGSNKNIISPSSLLAIFIILGGIISIVLAIFLIKKPIENLNSIASSLSHTGQDVGSASTQIASSSEQLSQAVTQQAASLQETSSSLEEINSMINANTENAKQSSLISDKSLNTAENGKIVIGHMLKAIDEINTSNNEIMNQIDETNKEVESIIKIINEIAAKTKIINEIVFQTKLLSFNASVEAARAAEHGRGFAVVAEEVGNLAATSGAAALEIGNMLEESVKKVEEIIRSSKNKMGQLVLHGKDKVEIGNQVAHECEDVLNEIVESMTNVSKMVSEISSAGQEQAQGVQEITKAITQLDQVTQQNSANSSDSANAAGDLSTQASALNSLVQKLMVTIEGGEMKERVPVHENITNKLSQSIIRPSDKKEKSSDLKIILPSHKDKRFEEV